MLFTEASLDRLAVHYAGNKQNGGALLLSKQEQVLGPDMRTRLAEALLARFGQCHERYTFHHSSSLDYNEVYGFSRAVFATEDAFFEQTIQMAKHLFDSSLHPRIKPGELYIAFFSGIEDGDQVLTAIGLFKAESRSLFADLLPTDEDLALTLKEGVEVSKMDKGCLVLNRGTEKGIELLIFDANGKGEEAQFWKDKFLGALLMQNEYVQTQEFLTLTKNFVTQQMPGEFEVSKTEQIDILNRSMDYFKTHGSFDRSEFETEVLHHDNLIDSFRKFGQEHRRDNALDPLEEFDISREAVKRQARVFKSVIKLDKNFHIYVHGDRQLIEKGFDEALQKHYYKIYFDHET